MPIDYVLRAAQELWKSRGLYSGDIDGLTGPATQKALTDYIASLLPNPETSVLSPKARDLILEYEVGGGQNYYEHYLSNPSWPGASSGVTIGIGYDLGYVTKEEFERDWVGLSPAVKALLSSTIGVKGPAAKSKISESIRSFYIPWNLALQVFENRTVAKFWKLTQQTFPGVVALPKDAQGAILSLVFNRGSSLDGDRRREMRHIRDLVAEYAKSPSSRLLIDIAEQFRAMKRLWRGQGLDGLLRRREAEAELIENSI